jgi:hypothetical protein
VSAIRKSASGEQCQIRIPGACNGNKETVVWCHGNGSAAGKGLGMKAPDLIGAYGCSACHDVYDRRAPAPDGMTREQVELAFCEGVWRSQRILVDKGLLRAA